MGPLIRGQNENPLYLVLIFILAMILVIAMAGGLKELADQTYSDTATFAPGDLATIVGSTQPMILLLVPVFMLIGGVVWYRMQQQG